MSEAEQLEQLPTEEPVADAPPAEAPDPVEAQAREHGWVSREEWDANPDNKGKPWRSAGEFVLYGEMIGKQRALEAKLEQYHASVREVTATQAKAIRQQLERQYQKEFESAVDEGDKGKAAKAADELAKLKEEPEVDPQAEAMARAVDDFKARNKWFNEKSTDPVESEMTDMAVAYDMALHKKGMANTEERLAEVEKRIRKSFPEKFANPNRSRPQTAEPSGQLRRVSKGNVPSLDSLGPDFQNVGRRWVRQGVFKTEKDYVQSLIDSGVLDV